MSFSQLLLRRGTLLFLAVLFSLILTLPGLAQNRVDVTGFVTDSTDVGLEGATVVALQAADSVLVSFSVTRPDGAFRLRRVPTGDYLLQVTFVGFAPFEQAITVGDEDLDVGRLALQEAVADLDELVISAEHVPMLIKSDTLEYNAAAFNVRPNANVEELLKRLPGVEVERDGSIKAQGEEVEQVLVDGKEFFGKDPTIATRNLPADAVERVQVYDMQSEMAEFTGVDDGQEEKTINLALKEDKKQGYFGKISGGYGGDDRFEGRANINRFSPSTQLSVIANGNNINQQSFSMGDYLSFMGGMQGMMAGGGRMAFSSGLVGGGTSAGFSTTLAGGLNFNHEFSKKTEVRSSYFINHLDNEQDRTVRQQQLFGAGVSSLAREDANQQSQNMNHRLNLNVKHEINDGHDVQLRANVQTTTSTLDNLSSRETLDADEVLQNTSNTTFGSEGDNLGGDASLTYRKRFAKGRSLVGEVRSRLNDGDMDGELMALNQFYQEGNLLTSDEIAQLQAQRDHTFTHTERLSYTEPLGKRRLLQAEIEHQSISEDQDKSFFDIVGQDSLSRNEDLSSAFERTYTYNRAGLNYRYNEERLSYGVGVDVQRSVLDGAILDADATVGNRFVHLLPSASLNYDISSGKHLNLRYNASTREPSMRELQPFADNSDPLNVYVGNPALRPEYQHNASLHFTLFDQFTFTNFFAFARATYAANSIVRARTIDEQFRQTLTSVNAEGDWTLSGSLSFGTPLRRLKSKINLSTQTIYNRGIEFINDEENATRILRSSWDVRLDNRNKDFVDASVGARHTFNVNRYSLNQDLNQSYINRSFYADLAYTPTDAWRFATSLDYQLYAEDVFGSGQSVPLWSAEISRSLLNNQVQVQLVATDLLNKNLGVNYSNTNTYIQEEQINTLGRYVMLKLVYNLSGFGGRNEPAIHIERMGD